MLDFVAIRKISKPMGKKDVVETVRIFPEFKVTRSDDLMIKGASFYAVWDAEAGMWSRNPQTVCRIIDDALRKAEKEVTDFGKSAEVSYMVDFSSKKWSEFLAYCGSLPDNYHELDTKLTFANDDVMKDDYVSKRLSYSIEPGPIDAWEECGPLPACGRASPRSRARISSRSRFGPFARGQRSPWRCSGTTRWCPYSMTGISAG